MQSEISHNCNGQHEKILELKCYNSKRKAFWTKKDIILSALYKREEKQNRSTYSSLCLQRVFHMDFFFQ